MTSEKNPKKSKLALAIESRERPSHEFEVQGFFGLGDKEIHKVAVRINTKSEDDAAVVAAHKYAHSFKGEGAISARKDSDVLTDGKAIEALYRACRGVGENGMSAYPAFPGPKWMRENMTTDQIAVLLNLYQEVRRAHSPVPWSITIDQVMHLSKACAETSKTDIPDEVLAKQPKEWVSQAFIILSQRFHQLIEEFKLSDKVDDWYFPESAGPDFDELEEDGDDGEDIGGHERDGDGPSEGFD